MFGCGAWSFKEGDVVRIYPRWPVDSTEFEVGIIIDGYEIPEEPEERLAEWRWRIFIDGKIRHVKDTQVKPLGKT